MLPADPQQGCPAHRGRASRRRARLPDGSGGCPSAVAPRGRGGAAYGPTTGPYIVEALVRAKERGVDVRLIADKTTPCEGARGIEPRVAASVPIWIDDQARILVSSSEVAAAYATHWHKGLALSVRFNRREDRCRVSSRTYGDDRRTPSAPLPARCRPPRLSLDAGEVGHL
jgi:hypothetical protein